jgi:hypothetical protein
MVDGLVILQLQHDAKPRGKGVTQDVQSFTLVGSLGQPLTNRKGILTAILARSPPRTVVCTRTFYHGREDGVDKPRAPGVHLVVVNLADPGGHDCLGNVLLIPVVVRIANNKNRLCNSLTEVNLRDMNQSVPT